MKRQRIMVPVWVDLDPVPGTFHTVASARQTVIRIVNDSIPHYHPALQKEPRGDNSIEGLERLAISLGAAICGEPSPPEATSECIRLVEHYGEHRDDTGGTWPNYRATTF